MWHFDVPEALAGGGSKQVVVEGQAEEDSCNQKAPLPQQPGEDIARELGQGHEHPTSPTVKVREEAVRTSGGGCLELCGSIDSQLLFYVLVIHGRTVHTSVSV